MVQKGALGHRRVEIGSILSKMGRMVYGSSDARATALAQLKEQEGGDPFRILIATILSQRTRDENTTKAVANLFARYSSAKELAGADEGEVRELIRPAGFYNVKAKSIIRVSRQILEEFNGRVPDKVDDLLKLHSVGRKTANCVLVYGYGIPAIPVDTHVHRISNRLGLVETRRPEETEEELTKKVPRRYWLELNDVFVRFGQTTCKPLGPRCEVCTLRGVCKYYREVVSPKRGKLDKPKLGGVRRANIRGGQEEGRRACSREGIREHGTGGSKQTPLCVHRARGGGRFVEEGQADRRDDRGADRRDLLRPGRLSSYRPQSEPRRGLREETHEEPCEAAEVRRGLQGEVRLLVPQKAVTTPPESTLFPTRRNPRLSMTSGSVWSQVLSRMISGNFLKVNSSSLDVCPAITPRSFRTP